MERVNESPDKTQYALIGRTVVASGDLRNLRRRLGFSRVYMAEVLGVTAITYRNWESAPDTNLHEAKAERVGRIYSRIINQLDDLEVDLRNYLPIYQVAPQLGIPQEELLRRYREFEFNALDLGILGLWVKRNTVILGRQVS